MATIQWDKFGGIRPALSRRLAFKQNVALRAHNAVIEGGKYSPLPCPKFVAERPYVVQSFTNEGCPRTWAEEFVRVVPLAPTSNDGERLFLVERPGHSLRVMPESHICSTAQGIPLGVNAPPPPFISASGGNCSCGVNMVTVRVSNYIGAPYFMESALSGPSNTVEVGSGGAVSVGGAYSGMVYATISDPETVNSGAEASSGYFYVSNGNFNVNQPGAVGELAPNDYWFPPPADFRLPVITDEGRLLGVSGQREVIVSEVGVYHAFPGDTDFHVDDDILDMQEHDGIVYLFTNGHPYKVIYNHNTSQYQVEKHPVPLPLASRHSIAKGHAGIVFASTQGLFLASKDGFTSLSDVYWTHDQWRCLRPEQMHGVVYHGSYYGFTDKYGFQLPFNDGAHNSAGKVELGVATIDSKCIHPTTLRVSHEDILYFSQGRKIFEWGAECSDCDPSCCCPTCEDECVGCTDSNPDCHPCFMDILLPLRRENGLMRYRALQFDPELGATGSLRWQIIVYENGQKRVLDEGQIRDDRPITIRGNIRYNDAALRVYGCGTLYAPVRLSTSRRALAATVQMRQRND